MLAICTDIVKTCPWLHGFMPWSINIEQLWSGLAAPTAPEL